MVIYTSNIIFPQSLKLSNLNAKFQFAKEKYKQ